jgi:DUF4097 and DUF4098 domain-containing protein YvlB
MLIRELGMVRGSGVFKAVLTAAVIAAMSGCIVVVDRNGYDSGGGPYSIMDSESYPDSFKRTSEMKVAHEVGKAIDIETENGSITVKKGGVDEVLIVAKLRSESQERLLAATVETTRRGDGTLVIRADWAKSRKGSDGCSFEVTIPDATGVSLETSNGGIETEGLVGESLLKSSNGAISVKGHVGNVKAQTTNGRVLLSAIEGGVKAESSNGAIALERINGPVDAETSNGSINVELAPTAVGPLKLQTSNGSIDATVSPAFSGRLVAECSSNGSIVANALSNAKVESLKKDRAVLVFGSGGERSSVSTTNGRITIKTSKPE